VEIEVNRNGWRTATIVAALSIALAGPSIAFPLVGGESAHVEPVVEYRNAALGEQLVTQTPVEIAALDAGAVPGWVRVRFAFVTVDGPAYAYVAPGHRANALPVCRYYIPPASHFLSASADECAEVGARVAGAILETGAAFHAWLPDGEGRCPRLFAKIGGFELAPVYRMLDSRHANAFGMTTSELERDALMADGWVPVGYGAGGVAMCVPSWTG
jgi:hypothetical protein